MTQPNPQEQAEPTFFQRFSLQARQQHAVQFISVITLVLTGIPLWFMSR